MDMSIHDVKEFTIGKIIGSKVNGRKFFSVKIVILSQYAEETEREEEITLFADKKEKLEVKKIGD